jgi:CheY-like chemotaxis protein
MGIKLDEGIFHKISQNIPIPKLLFCKIVTIVIKDVTQIEELNRKRFTTAYYTTVSHELKTPLNALCGSLGLLQPYILENGSNSYNVCKQSLKNLKSLVNSSLTLARIENGNLKQTIESTDIKKIISKSLEHSLYTITTKNLVTEIIISEKILNVLISKKLFKMIMQVLINNSIKYSFNNGKISISAECEEDKIIIIKISDEGAGIDACDLEQIFIPFGCIEKKEKENATGICLKLNLVKALTEKMGGKISVDSSLGAGTKFTLKLPCELDKNYRSTTCPKIEIPYAQNLMAIPISENPLAKKNKLFSANTAYIDTIKNSKTILVVDDNNYNVFIIEKLLDKLFLSYEDAPNGLEAVSKVRAKGIKNYSLIIMDLNMPIMNGLDASIKIIQMIESQTITKVPIVMLTAQDDEQIKAKCLAAGLADFIEKPITIDKLKYMIDHYSI